MSKLAVGLIGALALVLMQGTVWAKGGVTGSLGLHSTKHVNHPGDAWFFQTKKPTRIKHSRHRDKDHE